MVEKKKDSQVVPVKKDVLQDGVVNDNKNQTTTHSTIDVSNSKKTDKQTKQTNQEETVSNNSSFDHSIPSVSASSTQNTENLSSNNDKIVDASTNISQTPLSVNSVLAAPNPKDVDNQGSDPTPTSEQQIKNYNTLNNKAKITTEDDKKEIPPQHISNTKPNTTSKLTINTRKTHSVVEAASNEHAALDVLINNTKEPDWLYDRFQAASIQRNLMVVLNVIALLGIIVSVVCFTELAKRKTLDPFVIEIDKKTGIVTLVDQDKIKLFTPDQALNNFFLYQYLRNRETFDTKNYKYNYYKVVKSMSSATVFRVFLSTLRSSNPNSPMNIFVNNINSTLTVRSIQYIEPSTVQIRFTVSSEMPNSQSVIKNRIVLIQFQYSPVALSEEDRYLNPLGFTITSYNVSDEVL